MFEPQLLDKINRLTRSPTNREFLILCDRSPEGAFKIRKTISGNANEVVHSSVDHDFHNHTSRWSFARWAQAIDHEGVPQAQRDFFRDQRNIHLQPSVEDVVVWASRHRSYNPKAHGISALNLDDDKRIRVHLKVYDLSRLTEKEMLHIHATALSYLPTQLGALRTQEDIMQQMDRQYRFLHEPEIQRLNQIAEEVVLD